MPRAGDWDDEVGLCTDERPMIGRHFFLGFVPNDLTFPGPLKIAAPSGGRYQSVSKKRRERT